MILPMRDLSKPSGSRQIWITRTHLAGFGVGTATIAVLAFMVGLKIGRSEPAPTPVLSQAALTPDGSAETDLESLLREVERAQDLMPEPGAVPPEGDAEAVEEVATKAEEVDLSFPETLTEDAAPETPTEVEAEEAPSTTTVVPEPETTPEPPEPGSTEPPTDGWAIQVASFTAPSEADERIARLSTHGYNAYRVEALINGRTWYRVRVGGFDSRAGATQARPQLESAMGQSGTIVVEAP